MSLGSQAHRRCASLALVLTFVVLLLPSLVSAQDEAPPKVDLFIGYQWLESWGHGTRRI